MYTRSGNCVEHMEASHGRAARQESKRRRLKRKLLETASHQYDNSDNGAPGRDTAALTPARRRTTRAQPKIEEKLGTPPSASTWAATTPPSPSERFLRAGERGPMCTDYGRTCHFALWGQGFFFCNPCDLWDDRLPDNNIKPTRLSTRFRCTANYSCFSHPTSVCDEHCRFSTVKSNLVRDALDRSGRTSAGDGVDKMKIGQPLLVLLLLKN